MHYRNNTGIFIICIKCAIPDTFHKFFRLMETKFCVLSGTIHHNTFNTSILPRVMLALNRLKIILYWSKGHFYSHKTLSTIIRASHMNKQQRRAIVCCTYRFNTNAPAGIWTRVTGSTGPYDRPLHYRGTAKVINRIYLNLNFLSWFLREPNLSNNNGLDKRRWMEMMIYLLNSGLFSI
jgi:hypothetical protein